MKKKNKKRGHSLFAYLWQSNLSERNFHTYIIPGWLSMDVGTPNIQISKFIANVLYCTGIPSVLA